MKKDNNGSGRFNVRSEGTYLEWNVSRLGGRGGSGWSHFAVPLIPASSAGRLLFLEAPDLYSIRCIVIRYGWRRQQCVRRRIAWVGRFLGNARSRHTQKGSVR